MTTLKNQVSIIGVPFDDNASSLRGPALAPPRIRAAFHSESTNLTAENGVDLQNHQALEDLGDLEFAGAGDPFDAIETAIGRLVATGGRALALGGDHSITYPIMRSTARTHRSLTLLQLDAHPDLYDEFDGNRRSHACPFARIMEEGLVNRLVQVGIRGMNAHQREQADRFGVEVIDMRAWHAGATVSIEGPVYLSLDLDALDPAYAPGVSHPEAGGLTTRETIAIIQDLGGPIIGADLVEYNPNRDTNGLAGVAAAKLMKEILGKMLEANV